MRTLRHSAATALTLAAAVSGWSGHEIAHGQTAPPARPVTDTGIERLRPAPLPLGASPDFDLRLETPGRTPVPRAVDELRFELLGVSFEGASALSDETLRLPFQPLIGKQIALEDLRQAADRLEAIYRSRGHFLVRVLIPPQRVRDGRFVIRIIEGYIASVHVEGGSEPLRQRIERMLARVVGIRPVTLQSLERELLLINDLPGVQARGSLRQGSQEGAVELVVMPRTPDDVAYGSINNHASRALGLWGYSAGMQWREALAGRGELSLDLIGTGPGVMTGLSLRHAFPVGDSGAIASIGALAAHARPVGTLREDLGLDLESRSENVGLRLRYPLKRTRSESVFIEGGITASASRTTGVPAPACESDSEPEIADRVLGGELGLIWTRNGPFSSRQEFSLHRHRGVPTGWTYDTSEYASACRQPGTTDFEPRFARTVVQWSHAQPFGKQFRAQLVVRGQFSNDRLPPSERIAWGGMRLGRAHDSGAITGDRGYGALLELVWRPPLAGGDSRFQPPQWFVFADHAQAERLAGMADPATGGIQRMGSVGMGIRFALTPQLALETLVAKATHHVASTDPRPDPRVLVSLSGRF